MISKQLEFFRTLSQTQAIMTRRFEHSLGSLHGLGFGDFTILLHLSQAPEGRLRRVDLADRVGLTISAVTRTLIPMEKIGLVTRQSDARDARVAYAVITSAGQDLLTNSLAVAERVSKDAIPYNQEDRIEEFTELLDKIARMSRPRLG